MKTHEVSAPVKSPLTVAKITSHPEAIEFPTVEAPAPVAFVHEDGSAGTEIPSTRGPLHLDVEPALLRADDEPITVAEATRLFESGTARVVDPDKLIADLYEIHSKPRRGDHVRVTPGKTYGYGTLQGVARLAPAYVDAIRALAEGEWKLRKGETRDRYADTIEALDAPVWLTVDQVAAIFQVSPQTVMRRAGRELPAAVKFGRLVRFRAEAIARFAA